MRTRGLVSVLGVALLAAGGAALATTLDEDHRLSLEFATPHTDWAQPYARGPVRVLFFTSGVDTHAREIVELMQRFDIQAQAVYWGWENQLHGGGAGHDRMLRLLEGPTEVWGASGLTKLSGSQPEGPTRVSGLQPEHPLRRWDCYVFGEIPLTQLTPEEQYKVLRPVTEGAGLVMFGTDDARVFRDSTRLERPPFLALEGVGDTFHLGQGRGVRLAARPNLRFDVGWQGQYETWQEALGRAIIWAAGREPEVELRTVAVEPRVLPRAELPAPAIRVRWANTPEPQKLTFELWLRRFDGQITPLPGTTAIEAAGEIGCNVPVLCAGAYRLEVRATSKRGVEAWATVPFTVTAGLEEPAAVGASAAGEAAAPVRIVLARSFGEPGQMLEGSVTTAAPDEVARLPMPRIEVRLRDRRERVLDRLVVPAADFPSSIDFKIEPWWPMLVRVEAALLDDRGEVALGNAFFHVTKRHRGQFNFLIWDYPQTGPTAWGEAALAQTGTTVQLAWGNPPAQIAAYDIAWVPYTTRILDPKDENGYMQPVCWNHEPDVSAYVRGIVEPHEGSREHGVFVYSLGDENVTRGSCVHPACLAAYRRYLQDQYGTLQALNASWGSTYGIWDEVNLLQPGDNNEAEALRQKLYARWYDRQAFQCANYVQFCQRFAEGFKALDPRARTGFEGAGTFGAGDDYDLVVRSLGFWSPYPDTGDEIIRSIAPRDFPRANWMGYQKEADPLINQYWRMITRGMNSVWWWRWDNIGDFNGWLAPDLALWPATKELMADTRIVREGLGTLLLRSEMLDDGIAVLYSHPSAYATRLEGGPAAGQYQAAHTAWIEALRNVGLQFGYVTDRMLREGEFHPREFRVLILPRAEALGPQEAQAIRAFAEGGGTVIADVRPGLYDGHCKPTEAGVLDDLFGVQGGTRGEPVKLDLNLDAFGGTLKAAGALVDPGVRVTTGEALGQAGEAPVLVRRAVGSGQAILLNLSATSLPSLATGEQADQTAAFVRGLLALAGVEAPIHATGADGRRLRGTEIIRWRNGSTEIVAFYRQTGPTETARIELPAARFVYDLRTKKALGQTASFETRIVAGRPSWYALLLREAADVALGIKPKPAAAGTVPVAHLSARPGEGLRALRLQATRPDGTAADWLDQVVLVGELGADVPLPIAFNDPVGRWRVTATDLYTGRASEATFEVR